MLYKVRATSRVHAELCASRVRCDFMWTNYFGVQVTNCSTDSLLLMKSNKNMN